MSEREQRPPALSAEERSRRAGGFIPLDYLPRPWLHDFDNDMQYRWLVKNRVMRNDKHGIEITYRVRRSRDVICGERTIRPGIPDFHGYSWRMDQSVPHEVVCTIVGDHGEAPHIGVPADCADMTCRCALYGCDHLVIVGFAQRAEAAEAERGTTGDGVTRIPWSVSGDMYHRYMPGTRCPDTWHSAPVTEGET